jgi:hypothetical protein
MKNLNTIKFYFLTLLILTFTYSCGSSKSKVVVEKPVKGQAFNEIVFPCSGSEYSSDNKNFRGTGSGTSLNMNQAKQMATRASQLALAQDMSTAISSVADDYSKQVQKNTNSDYQGRWEAMTRSVTDEIVNSMSTDCERSTIERKNVNGQSVAYYTFWTAKSSDVDKVFEKLSQTMSNDEILKIDYDYEKFKETYEKEMEKRRKS